MKIISGRSRIAEEAADLLYDESRYTEGTPERIYFPECEEDVIKAAGDARRDGKQITVIGGQTGITGGAVPSDGCYGICFSSMDRIIGVDGTGDCPILVCEPGITLEKIEHFCNDPANWPYKVEGAQILGKDRFYPPDPTEMTAQLGGTLATNASGARSYRFGPTRNHIALARVLFGNGETVTIRRGDIIACNRLFSFDTDSGKRMVFQRPFYTSIAIKNASGYFSRPRMDLLDLLIGSEGTLAIFLKAGISLQKKPAFLSGLSFFPSRDSVFDFADFLRTEQQVSAMEYFDRTAVAILEQNRSRIPAQFPNVPENKKNAVYWEVIESTPGIFESSFDRWDAALSRCGSSFDETWSGFEPVEADRLKVFRHAVPELINAVVAENKRSCPQVRKISTDSALPSSAFRKVFTDAIRLIEESSIPHAIFGHLGDFHLHMNIMPRNEMELDIALDIYHEIMSVSIQNGGTVSAEHGIGKIKREYLKMMYGSEGILEMKKVKAVLDHESMLNPGNLF